MSAILIAVLVAVGAVIIAIGGTWYAWQDYHRHPDRYGYRPGERQRHLAKPDRGVTHQAVRRWSSLTRSRPAPRHAPPRLPTS
jgi:hypothetical protein